MGFSEIALFNVMKTLEFILSLVEKCPTNKKLMSAILDQALLSHIITVSVESSAQCQILANRILQHIINFNGFKEERMEAAVDIAKRDGMVLDILET